MILLLNMAFLYSFDGLRSYLCWFPRLWVHTSIKFLLLSLMEEDQSLFADRPEWADVVPLEQYEGVTPIAPIFYTPECACIQ